MRNRKIPSGYRTLGRAIRSCERQSYPRGEAYEKVMRHTRGPNPVLLAHAAARVAQTLGSDWPVLRFYIKPRHA